MQAHIEYRALEDGRVEVIRWVDGELDVCAEIDADHLSAALKLLQFDEDGCLFANVDMAA